MSTTNLSAYDPNKMPDTTGMSFAIIVSDWNSEITYAMRDGAIETLKKHRVKDEHIDVYHVPGSFELVYASKKIQQEGSVDAIIALGSVVRGGTPHFDYVCSGTTTGLSMLNAYDDSDIPVIFGLLTTDNMEQARDRAGGKLGNKGVECAVTAIKMIAFNKQAEEVTDREENKENNTRERFNYEIED